MNSDDDIGMLSEHEIKTRVTTLEEMKVERTGDDCLVVIYAKDQADLGERFVLKRETTIGRTNECDITLDVDSVSRKHARVERQGAHFTLVDLDSTNGTYLNEDPEPIVSAQLRRGDQVKIGSTIFKYLTGSDVEAQYHEAIFNMTVQDGLTGLSNRKQLDLVLVKEIPRAQRHERALAMVMLDIDHFKAINDTQGHVGGDTILRELAQTLKRRLRPDDELGRYGGEEFCAILPETTLREAIAISEDLRATIEEHPFVVEGERIEVTVSIGVAALGPQMTMTDLYRAADAQLYEAKRRGRNRVCAEL